MQVNGWFVLCCSVVTLTAFSADEPARHQRRMERLEGRLKQARDLADAQRKTIENQTAEIARLTQERDAMQKQLEHVAAAGNPRQEPGFVRSALRTVLYTFWL